MSLRISVIVGSTREGRLTIRPARFIHRLLSEREGIESDLIDLAELDLPMMKERLRFDDDAPESVRRFSRMVDAADGLVIASPEYNHGYPGVLKNALDYLLPEYKRKPAGIMTVSAGAFGGVRCCDLLRVVCSGLGLVAIPRALPITSVGKSFDEDGSPNDDAWNDRGAGFIDELIWYTEAITAKKGEARD